ncbi:MAG: hypothetical protein ROO70_03260 [Labrenzia sp.]|uniref:hypothetical protein n=1 Tax=Labrenzia sp. R4_2 TaxID=2821107 RepID=UPI001ADA7D9C|nr:hypothetical protein [Labrenzia sp. R4_2]MBO9418891.1 hypothetical protein [Labrenzia sp. R4_2]
MSIMFDTLGYSKYLQSVGISQPEADKFAFMARDYVSEGPLTKQELDELLPLEDELLTKEALAELFDAHVNRLTVKIGIVFLLGLVGFAVAMVYL